MKKIFFVVFLLSFLVSPTLFSPSEVQAQIKLRTVADWEAGSIVLLNGYKFVKLNGPGGDGMFMAMEAICNIARDEDIIIEQTGEGTDENFTLSVSNAVGMGPQCSWSAETADGTAVEANWTVMPDPSNNRMTGCTIQIPKLSEETIFTPTVTNCNMGGDLSTNKTITVIDVPTNFTSVPACGKSILTATPGDNADIVRWYSAVTGGIPIAESNSYFPNLSSNTTLYISSYNTTTLAESERIPVTGTASIPTTDTMQGFTQTECNALSTNGTVCLRDTRDNKGYNVRKLADGNCWMVDNLAYGGSTDNCVNKTSALQEGASATNRFGSNTYGDCLDPAVADLDSGSIRQCGPGGTLAGQCGYLYNWQAAMQHATAYSGSTYSGPDTNVTGLCPTGWTLPTGNTSGQFQALGNAGSWTHTQWADSTLFNGIFAGISGSWGLLYNQG